ncbi:unnamed protein product [Discosporangium mesarthrocarpum]
MIGTVSGVILNVNFPGRLNAYHPGATFTVRWTYDGTGSLFHIVLHKAGEPVVDLCENEEGGACFDLTQDQTVTLPASGLESGSDYTVAVTDKAIPDVTDESEPFSIISDSNEFVVVTVLEGDTEIEAGTYVSVSWLYVGQNKLFDVYIRQEQRRVSENLCVGLSPEDSCVFDGNPVQLHIPASLPAGTYSLLVVDRENDDAFGETGELMFLAAGAGSVIPGGDYGGDHTKLVVVLSSCVGGVILLAAVLLLARQGKKRLHSVSKEMIGSSFHNPSMRRSMPPVHLSVEAMYSNGESPGKLMTNPMLGNFVMADSLMMVNELSPATEVNSEEKGVWPALRRSSKSFNRVIHSISRSESQAQEPVNTWIYGNKEGVSPAL